MHKDWTTIATSQSGSSSGTPVGVGHRLHEDQRELVQSSFAVVAYQPERAARMFYARLFELDPGLRKLFKHDMDEQGRKLMAILAIAVANLHQLETIIPSIRALGQRHAGYGVRDEHYDTVATALLWTLEQALGDAFTAATSDAWAAAYQLLAGKMKEAAMA